MNIKKSTYELLQPIIEAIDLTFTIDSIVDNTGGYYTIYSCNTLWATKGFTVTIDGDTYLIKEVNPNTSITVYSDTNTLDLSIKTFELYEPKFYHGTVKATETDLNREENNRLWTTDKLPMIWLHESVEEMHYNNEDNPVARDSRCELYFMIDADIEAWDNEDHYELAIRPMRNLIESFDNAMKLSGLVNYQTIDNVKVMDFARWGTYLDRTGSEKKIFSQCSMSGSKLEITIPFIRNQENCC